MKGAQESRDTGAASLDKGTRWGLFYVYFLVQLDGRRPVVCSFVNEFVSEVVRQFVSEFVSEPVSESLSVSSFVCSLVR